MKGSTIFTQSYPKRPTFHPSLSLSSREPSPRSFRGGTKYPNNPPSRDQTRQQKKQLSGTICHPPRSARNASKKWSNLRMPRFWQMRLARNRVCRASFADPLRFCISAGLIPEWAGRFGEIVSSTRSGGGVNVVCPSSCKKLGNVIHRGAIQWIKPLPPRVYTTRGGEETCWAMFRIEKRIVLVLVFVILETNEFDISKNRVYRLTPVSSVFEPRRSSLLNIPFTRCCFKPFRDRIVSLIYD